MAQPAQAPVNARTRRGRAGQAAVELAVALVCILLVVSGLLQFILLAHADTDTMAEATARASDDAAGGGLSASFQPVRDWRKGRDGLIFTRDDEKSGGNLASIRSDIAAKTAPNGDWSATTGIRATDIRELAETGAATTFGFVHERSEQQVEILPAAAALFGLRDPTVGNDVWMVKVGDIY